MTAYRLDTSVWLPDKEAGAAARYNQRQHNLVPFEIGQIVVSEKYFAPRTAHENT